MSKNQTHFDTLPDLPIEEICQNMLKEGKYNDLSAFVQTSKRIHSLCQKYLDILLKKHIEKIMDTMNTLGPAYNGQYGLRGDPLDISYVSKRVCKYDDTNWIRKLITNNYAEMYIQDPYNCYGRSSVKIEDINDFFVYKQCIVLDILYDEKYLNYLSELKLNFNEIIVRKKKFTNKDTSKLIEWYNHIPSENRVRYYIEDLDPISTRQFIKITEPFVEVHLYKELKHEKLIIDDILFASRALMIDKFSKIDKYTLISNDGGCLVLEIDFK